MAAMRDAPRRAGARRRRRGVRLPRRARPAGAGAGCSASASSGPSGSRTSRAGCGGATLRYNPRFVAGFARQYAAPPPSRQPRASLERMATTSPSSAAAASACRSRSRFADRGLRVLGVDNDRRAPGGRRATAACPSTSPGADELARARARRRTLELVRPRRRRRAGRRTSSSRSARRRSRTSRSTCATSARRSTTCCRSCARATSLVLRSTSRRARPSSSPATWPSTAASRSARTSSSPTCPSASPPAASSRRSATLPCIVGGVGERLGRARRRSCSRSSARRSCRPRRSQAELAKIWTNILRYATFALPNLLMMDCEQYGANVFEVIDLINRDYPRGGMAQPGFTAGHLPAQGLRVLRGALERAGHAARRLARQRVGAAVPRRGHQAPARARCAAARSRCSASPSRPTPTTSATRSSHKLIRLLERELADVAVHDPHVRDADAVLRGGGRRRRRGRRRHQPLRVPRAGDAARDRRQRARGDALVVDPWNCFGAGAGLRATRASWRMR